MDRDGRNQQWRDAVRGRGHEGLLPDSGLHGSGSGPGNYHVGLRQEPRGSAGRFRKNHQGEKFQKIQYGFISMYSITFVSKFGNFFPGIM